MFVNVCVISMQPYYFPTTFQPRTDLAQVVPTGGFAQTGVRSEQELTFFKRFNLKMPNTQIIPALGLQTEEVSQTVFPIVTGSIVVSF